MSLITNTRQQQEVSKLNQVCSSSFSFLGVNNQIITLDKPCIMGVINMSPNSFFSPYLNLNDAIDAVAQMVQAGAAIIDIGGEATNPRVDIVAEKPAIEQELERILPLLQQIKQRFPVLISIDTSSPAVMRAAVAAGADMINDQRALEAEGALEAIADLNVPVCLMHFFDSQRVVGSTDLPTMLQQVIQELKAAIQRCLVVGIDPRRIIVDPGFGQGNYGKNCAENYYLLAHLPELLKLGYPVLAGWSRKSMIGDVLGGAPPNQRLYGSIAAATIAALQGAAIIRVHDVAATVDAVKVSHAFLSHLR